MYRLFRSQQKAKQHAPKGDPKRPRKDSAIQMLMDLEKEEEKQLETEIDSMLEKHQQQAVPKLGKFALYPIKSEKTVLGDRFGLLPPLQFVPNHFDRWGEYKHSKTQ